ncbi:MAG: M56 family metallopeptidase [Bacteroidia bacterium]
MQIVDLLFPPQLAQSLGWTLLHSLWQGAILALGLRMFLRILKGRSPQTAYIASLCTLVLMLGASIVTLYIEYKDAVAMMEVASHPMVVWAPVDQIAPALLESGGLIWKQAIPCLSVVWLTGLVFFAVRWLGGLWYLQRLRVSYTFEVDYGWQHKLNQLAHKMGISRAVTLLESGRVQVPMVLGHLKPVILLPLGLLAGISPKQLESILAHELSHIHRYDFLINQILALVEMVFFYHPAYWWVSNQIEENREHCCDDMAVAVCEDAITYARMLTELEARRQNMPMMALGMAGRKNGLFRRVERIVQPQASPTQKDRASIIPAILLTSCLIGLVWTKPQAQTAETIIVPETEIPIGNLPLTVSNDPAITTELRITPSANALSVPAVIGEDVPPGDLNTEPIVYWNEADAPIASEPVFVNLARTTDRLSATLDNLVFDLDRVNVQLASTTNRLVMVMDSPPLPPVPPRPVVMPALPAIPALPALPSIDWEGEMNWEDDDQRVAYEMQLKEYAKAQKEWAKEFEKTWAKDGKSWKKEMEVFQRDMQVWQEDFQRTYAKEIRSGETSAEMREDMRHMNEERRALERLHAARSREHAEIARVQAREHAEIAREIAREHAEVARIQVREQAEMIREQAQLQAELARVESQVSVEQVQQQAVLLQRELEALQRHRIIEVEAQERERGYLRYQNRLLRELERDGLIDSDDSRVKVDITEDYVKVNGRRLNRSLARKYRKMAEDYNVEEGRIIFREK